MKILLVEDDPLLGPLMAENISAKGHDVTCAEDHLVAIKLLAGLQFDLVVTDKDVPELNAGLEVIRYARSMSCPPMVILLSGRADDPGVKKSAIDLGALDALTKPTSIADLFAAVNRSGTPA